jgi:hypothetical protein
MLSILNATETAVVTYFQSNIDATIASFYTGMSNVDKQAPTVIVWCRDAKEEVPYSGLWHTTTQIIIKEVAAESNAIGSLAHTVYSTLLVDGIQDLLTSTHYTVIAVIIQDNTTGVEQDMLVNILTCDIVGELS